MATTLVTTVGKWRIELAGQDRVAVHTGGPVQTVSLAALEAAAGQADEVLATTYRAIYDAARRLHDGAAGQDSSGWIGGPKWPTTPYVTAARRRETARLADERAALYALYAALDGAAKSGEPIRGRDVGIQAGHLSVDRIDAGQIVLDGRCRVTAWDGHEAAVECRLDQSDDTLYVHSARIVSLLAAGRARA